MNYSQNNNGEQHADVNWNYVKVSDVDKRIINKLIKNLLTLPISEDLFISFDSLIKIGKKSKDLIEKAIAQMGEEHNQRIFLLNYLRELFNMDAISFSKIPLLYNPDFIVRARTILGFENDKNFETYLKYLLPLLNDPDDSVRWALVKILDERVNVNNKKVLKKLKHQRKKEPNKVIKKKISNMLLEYDDNP